MHDGALSSLRTRPKCQPSVHGTVLDAVASDASTQAIRHLAGHFSRVWETNRIL